LLAPIGTAGRQETPAEETELEPAAA
jgi:hypothetical protein